MKYNVLLFYVYSKIENTEEYREQHHVFCIENNLKGRIIISQEGLNGTVSGMPEDCDKYMAYVKGDGRFNHVEFKVEPSDEHAFAKLHVRVKPEIVNSSLHHINPNEATGTYVEPAEFRNILQEQPEDTVIVDVRSKYEHEDIDNFREFPAKLDELEQFRDKKVITYCTGGIKCEKASAFLLEQGFENVFQLHGGIIKYGIEEQGEDFEGKCYVFDNRVVKEVNTVNPTVISKCYITGEPSDRMVNCANPECNMHIPMSEKGAEVHKGCCSDDCMKHPEVRSYDGTGAYGKEMNGYNPYKGWKRRQDG